MPPRPKRGPRGRKREDMRNILNGYHDSQDFSEEMEVQRVNGDDPDSQLLTRLMGLATSLQAESMKEGTQMLENGQLDEARDFFYEKAKKLVGPGVPLPSIGGVSSDGDGVKNDLYTKMSLLDIAKLMGCCNGMAHYYTAKRDFESALSWYEEVDILMTNTRFEPMMGTRPLHDWIDYSLDVPELNYQHVYSLVKSAELFEQLGNTATLVQRRWKSCTAIGPLQQLRKSPELDRLVDMDKVRKAIQLRHPDPKLCHKLSVEYPRLQIQGSWKKMHMKMGEAGPGPRQRFASFIWESRLYVFGGWEGEMNMVGHKDLWCIDLTEEDEAKRVWRRLPDYPIRVSSMLSFAFVVQKEQKRAYLITGTQDVDYFDLVSESWGRARTTFSPTEDDRAHGVRGYWPFPGQELQDAAVMINGTKVYTFGGTHRDTMLGCNLLMELDLETKEWKRLSGHVVPQVGVDQTIPGPRKSPSGWIGPCKDRMYVFQGHAERYGAHMKGQLHGSSMAYGYHDFWSWSISQGKWRRERISGNPPLSRTEMACTFNEKLNKTIIFGGYAPCMPSLFIEKNQNFECSYYADTFVYDYPRPNDDSASLTPYTSTDPNTVTAPSTTSYPRWKQVLTHGFPTYRCHSHLNTDPDTGKMYLFGGFTNSDYVPSRSQYSTRPFGDLWQLRMDVPGDGGDFESVDVEEEARTAGAGPWKRCFACGNSGIWKRCAGKCGGKAYFCGRACQKEGWREHKNAHACRK